MSLIPEHEQHHSLGPKDVGIKWDKPAAMHVEVVRTTNQTGEQICVKVPVYGDESREELQKRLAMAYSIIQDRLEDENKAVNWRNEKGQTARRAAEKVRRKEIDLKDQLKPIEKEIKAATNSLKTAKSKTQKEEAQERLDAASKEKAQAWANYKESAAPFMEVIEHVRLELAEGKNLPFNGKGLDELLLENPDARDDEEAQEPELSAEI